MIPVCMNMLQVLRIRFIRVTGVKFKVCSSEQAFFMP
ncbi:MAG: hypothetical protein K0R00_2614 [Herbinix sp.]|jgi:hypothetical protein|nr:hypothetical protein [Herbinix sp.]